MTPNLATRFSDRLRSLARRFLREQDGPTAVEYAAMLALIVMLAVGAISALGRKNSAIWAAVGDAIGDVL